MHNPIPRKINFRDLVNDIIRKLRYFVLMISAICKYVNIMMFCHVLP